jgi:hypothetical protein
MHLPPKPPRAGGGGGGGGGARGAIDRIPTATPEFRPARWLGEIKLDVALGALIY